MFLIFRLFSLYKQPYSESTLRKAKIMDFLNYFLSNKKWQKYENYRKIVKNNKFKVYDLRNLYDAEEMKSKKIKYYSVGRPNIN